MPRLPPDSILLDFASRLVGKGKYHYNSPVGNRRLAVGGQAKRVFSNPA